MFEFEFAPQTNPPKETLDGLNKIFLPLSSGQEPFTQFSSSPPPVPWPFATIKHLRGSFRTSPPLFPNLRSPTAEGVKKGSYRRTLFFNGATHNRASHTYRRFFSRLANFWKNEPRSKFLIFYSLPCVPNGTFGAGGDTAWARKAAPKARISKLHAGGFQQHFGTGFNNSKYHLLMQNALPNNFAIKNIVRIFKSAKQC